MERDNKQPHTAEHVTDAVSHSAESQRHLRQLWSGVQHTSAVVARATAAYLESRALLARINGFAASPMTSEIHLPDNNDKTAE